MLEPNLAKIVERLRKRNADEERSIAERVREARGEVVRLKAEFLRIDPDIEKIVLFGSLAEDRVDRLDFDIDIAVSSDQYMRLLRAALDSPFKVDCIDMADARDWLLRDIDEYGKVLYEKG